MEGILGGAPGRGQNPPKRPATPGGFSRRERKKIQNPHVLKHLHPKKVHWEHDKSGKKEKKRRCNYLKSRKGVSPFRSQIHI